MDQEYCWNSSLNIVLDRFLGKINLYIEASSLKIIKKTLFVCW
jgi:hypothetical protein